MADKVLLAWPNKIDESSALSGGSYLPTLPLTNAADRIFAKKARTVDTLPASTKFNVLFSEGKKINVVVLAAHNFTIDATFRVVMYSDLQMTSILHDSGVMAVWPPVYQTEQLEWEYSNFWAGNLTESQRREFTPLATYVVRETYVPQAVTVEIFDQQNPSGYVEFGRVFLAESFEPTVNMMYGAQMGYEVRTDIEVTLNNNEFFDVKTPKRTSSISFDGLSQGEAYGRLYSMMRTQGIDKEVFFTYNTNYDSESYTRTFLGRIQSPDPISQPYIDRYSKSLNLVELL